MNKPSTMLDQAFDQLAEHFQQKIYNSAKGEIRLALLQKDLSDLQAATPCRVLDAGGGLGHMSRWFAAADHQVTLLEPAENMLKAAAKLDQEAGLEQRITTVQSTLSAYTKCAEPASFEVILCHAVLEWLQDPHAAITELEHLLAPGGRLSLMFYNQHSLVLRNALRGNLKKVKRADWKGDGKGLTPFQALLPEQVYSWLEQQGLQVELTSGIRCFYDYLPAKARDTYAFDDILELELNHYRQQPYTHMARYIHVLAHKLP